MPKSIKHNSNMKVVVNVNSYNKKSGHGGGGGGGSKSGFNGNLPGSSNISNVTYPPNYYSPFRDAIQHQTLEPQPTPQGIKQKQPYYLNEPKQSYYADEHMIPDNQSEISSIENSYNDLERDIQMNKLKQNFLVNYEENQQHKSPLTSYNLSRAASELALGKQNNNSTNDLYQPSSNSLSVSSNPSVHLSDLQSVNSSNSNKTINLDPSQINYNYGANEDINNDLASSQVQNAMTRFQKFLNDEKLKSPLLLDYLPSNVEVRRPAIKNNDLLLMQEPYIHSDDNSLHYDNYLSQEEFNKGNPLLETPNTKNKKMKNEQLERYKKYQLDYNVNSEKPLVKLNEVKTIDNIDLFINKIKNKVENNEDYKLSKEEKKELGILYKSELLGKKLTGNTKYAKTALLQIINHKNEIDQKKELIKLEKQKKEEAIMKDRQLTYPKFSNPKNLSGLLAGGAVEGTDYRKPPSSGAVNIDAVAQLFEPKLKRSSPHTYKGPMPQVVNANQLLQTIRETKKR
jgi:hypothetical protein